jgi:hypothetical protein
MIEVLGPAERLKEQPGVTVAIFGPTGVGKTSLAGTLGKAALPSAVVVSAEAGMLPIRGLPVASVDVRTMQTFMDIACVLGGPDPALPSSSAFSAAHYAQVSADPDLMALAKYSIIFVDSLTALSRLSFKHCEQLPEATTDRGKKDTRWVYGAHARLMLSALNHLQHARDRTVIFVAILERVTDDFHVATWQPQLEGAKTARELPGIVDQVITMQWVDFGDGKPVRTFVCTSPNPWGYPAKDRSGRLDQLEPPDLGRLLAKLTNNPASQTSSGDQA